MEELLLLLLLLLGRWFDAEELGLLGCWFGFALEVGLLLHPHMLRDKVRNSKIAIIRFISLPSFC